MRPFGQGGHVNTSHIASGQPTEARYPYAAAPYLMQVESELQARGPWSDLKRLPPIVNLVLLFLLITFIWSKPIFGFNSSGIAWVIPCAFSLLIVARNFNQVTFPFVLWIPWMVLLFGFLALVDPTLIDPRVIPYQRTVQVLSPLFVGMAVSTWRPCDADLDAFLATCRRLSYLILVTSGLMTGVLLTGVLPSITGLAPQAITVTLLCSLFVSSYAIRRSPGDLLCWCLLACVPVIALTRTAIVAAFCTFPSTLSPLPISRRLVAVVLIAVAGVAIFNTERVQKKMFFSGKGSVQDISERNDDFATSGRRSMWTKMSAAVDEEFMTGHGTGMGESFTYNFTGSIAYPHNDWLLTMYDYGLVGVIVYLICILLTMLHAFQQGRENPHQAINILLLTGAAGYIPFAIMMFTDNIMVYAAYFGNLHYIFLGVAYGALQVKNEARSLGLPGGYPV
jgi:hypothetical protein